jgi:hypothetical protein
MGRSTDKTGHGEAKVNRTHRAENGDSFYSLRLSKLVPSADNQTPAFWYPSNIGRDLVSNEPRGHALLRS